MRRKIGVGERKKSKTVKADVEEEKDKTERGKAWKDKCGNKKGENNTVSWRRLYEDERGEWKEKTRRIKLEYEEEKRKVGGYYMKDERGEWK
jgi:hypothetical protein